MKKTSINLTILTAMLAIFGLSVNAQYTKLLEFEGTTNGRKPSGSLIYDGNFLYGLTKWGGTSDYGTVFKIMPDGSGYIKLLDFEGITNGSGTRGSLITDHNFLYGMTAGGGANYSGTIFKIKPDGSGYVKLLDFANSSNENSPYGSLFYDGNFLFGMTAFGGTSGYGTIFKIKPDGSGFVKLLDFEGAANGREPHGSLISDGTYLYGMTNLGGTTGITGCGIIFKIKTDGSGYIKLLDFDGTTNGSYPYGDLIYEGNFLYGMTTLGGTHNKGTIFRIMPDGSGYAKLFDFDGVTSGDQPLGSLISHGNYLYGMTKKGGMTGCGTIFKIKHDGSGYVKLLDFQGSLNGCEPYGSLIYDSTFLYGMTNNGGTYDNGVVFKLGIITSINENYENKSIAVFPNPASDIVTVNMDSDRNNPLTLNIYSLSGKLVRTELMKQGQQQISIGDLNDGFYIIEMKSQEWIDKQKLIIQR